MSEALFTSADILLTLHEEEEKLRLNFDLQNLPLLLIFESLFYEAIEENIYNRMNDLYNQERKRASELYFLYNPRNSMFYRDIDCIRGFFNNSINCYASEGKQISNLAYTFIETKA